MTPVEKPEQRRLEQEWLHAFCGNVKTKTGKWVYRGFRWHAFSYGYEDAKHGPTALEYYRSLRPKRLFVFSDTGAEIGFVCEGIAPPDLSSLHDDWYVFPRSLLWTMFFTHEQPDIGPFLACRDWPSLGEKRG